MKSILHVITVLALSFLQILFLPINFALLFVLFLVYSADTKAALVPLIAASFLVSTFGNLGFGLTLISFSASVILFLILKNFLPDNKLARLVPFIVVLFFWEVLMRFELSIYSKFL